ncbi:MAG: EamA family transporter [Verrucomicrobiota bacterium]
MKNGRDLALNYLLLGAISLIWGTQFMLIERANDTFPPFTMAACRFSFGALTITLLLPFLGRKQQEMKPAWPGWKLWCAAFIVACFDGTIPFTCLPFGERHVPSDVASIFMGLTPIFTLVFAWLLVPGERFTWQSVLSLALGMLGIILLVGFRDAEDIVANLVAEGAILLAAASLAFALVLLRMLPRGNAIWKTYLMLICAAIQAMILAFIFEDPLNIEPTAEAWLLVVVMGILPSATVTLLYVLLTDRAGPTFTALNNYVVPLVAVFAGIVLLGNTIEASTWIALGVILAAMAVKELRLPQREPAQQS